MRTRTVLDRWSASLLATLGVLPVVGCSSSEPASATFPCKNPGPLVQGTDTGYEVCDTGFVHRESVHACPSKLPRATDAGAFVPADPDAGFSGSCSSDSDCTAHPDGFCSPNDPKSGGNAFSAQCYYGCVSDSDCDPGNVCLCGALVGLCVAASCKSDADCGSGSLCTMSTSLGTCPSGVPFACQTPHDSCGGDKDCSANGSSACGYSGSEHKCVAACVFGRPFLVRGAARTAGNTGRSDWTATLAPGVEGPSAAQRQALGVAWTRAAQMEHASIAAFARFALQLLSVGAPASLVEETHEAMRDETEHAKLCFALASAYSGRAIGPAALSVGDALADMTPESILTTTILEGCVGETVAAVEATEALEHTRDPVVRSVLAKIAEDERRHAELAWRYVQWAVSKDARLREVAAWVFESVVQERGAGSMSAEDPGDGLLVFGVVPEPLRREIRARVLESVIAPCAKAVLGSTSHEHLEPQRVRVRRTAASGRRTLA